MDAMDIRLAEIEAADRTEELVGALMDVWRSSVEATHDFLTPPEIDAIAGYVTGALREIPRLVVACVDDAGAPVAFAGVAEDSLEMLFVAPEMRGRGIGGRLLRHAVEHLGVRRLDVNEQNPQARGFYEHEGFCVVGRSETDAQGGPYPILHMELGRA